MNLCLCGAKPSIAEQSYTWLGENGIHTEIVNVESCDFFLVLYETQEYCGMTTFLFHDKCHLLASYGLLDCL